MDQFEREALLIGREGIEKLRSARVALFGIGGVGGYVAEALIRCGVGSLDFYDNDRVSLSNLNRQLIALHSTVGRDKADVMTERLLDINPEAKITGHKLFYLPEEAGKIDFASFDYIADAIDTVAAKLDIAEKAYRLGIPLISAMGAGNRLDPTQFRVGDIYETENCPLARVMRRELRKRGIPALKVVYSVEPAITPQGEGSQETSRRAVPGSIAFVPPVMGLIMASVIVRDIIGEKGAKP
ncbi:MAG: tRNA threonylcarbamoyladenosine dehydratase [Clostridia bacterium]|nr:tRNA threonylcarbamoyladenosine dehydratase [Clostridia bacterium]